MMCSLACSGSDERRLRAAPSAFRLSLQFLALSLLYYMQRAGQCTRKISVSSGRLAVRSQAAAAPHHEGEREGEHHRRGRPPDLHDRGLALHSKNG